MFTDGPDDGMVAGAVALRPIRESDAKAYHAGEDHEIVRWLSGGRAPLAGVRSYFAGLVANAATGRGKRAFGIWVDGRLAGYLEVDPDVRDGLGEEDVNVAYAVLPWARRRGVARDAVRMIAARIRMDGRRAALRIDTQNEASTRVAAAAGFTFAGEIVSTTDRGPDGSPARLRIFVAPRGGGRQDDRVLADLWSPYGIVLTTPRLVLRLPHESELVTLAELAARGVHAPGVRPFLTPWTEGAPQDRARSVLQSHWGRLASWDRSSWALGLAVFLRESGEVLGQVTLRASDFAVTREVSTGSWLGLEYHRRGYGTEARTALLALAFDHLGASDATTEVFPDNVASQGVSRRLGYRPDGISRDRRGDEVVASDRLRLTKDGWDALEDRVRVEVAGLDAARTMFG